MISKSQLALMLLCTIVIVLPSNVTIAQDLPRVEVVVAVDPLIPGAENEIQDEVVQMLTTRLGAEG